MGAGKVGLDEIEARVGLSNPMVRLTSVTSMGPRKARLHWSVVIIHLEILSINIT